jgi:hypothetical protein
VEGQLLAERNATKSLVAARPRWHRGDPACSSSSTTVFCLDGALLFVAVFSGFRRILRQRAAESHRS